jgi:hypothetical protein
MNPSFPQLDQRRRERIEAALDIALAALYRIQGHGARPGAGGEITRQALTRIEALPPERLQQR